MKYVIFNKPYGVLCQFTDPAGRPTLKDYIPIPKVYSVGRLDFDSEGLLLLTNDSKINHQLSDPNNCQEKTYWAQVEGVPTDEMLIRLRSGVMIKGKRTCPAKANKLKDNVEIWERPVPIRFRKNKPTSWLEIKIVEGRNRQVRKMTAAVGLPCLRLIRVAIGPVQLGDLKSGEYKLIERPNL